LGRCANGRVWLPVRRISGASSGVIRSGTLVARPKRQAKGASTVDQSAVRRITGAFGTTPVGQVLKEEPTEATQTVGVYGTIVGIAEREPDREYIIRLITFREGDRHAQPGE